jgi:hypothetical protein
MFFVSNLLALSEIGWEVCGDHRRKRKLAHPSAQSQGGKSAGITSWNLKLVLTTHRLENANRHHPDVSSSFVVPTLKT